MSDLHFLLVCAKPYTTRLVIRDGIVVDVANEGVGKMRFFYFFRCILGFLQEMFL